MKNQCDALRRGELQAMNSFTQYWSGRMPASVFLAAYPLGLRQPHEWDVFYYGLGGLEIAREGSGGYFAFTCAHGIVDSQKDERLRGILNRSRMTMPDGMPTVWLGRIKGRDIRRVTAPDFFETVMRDRSSVPS